MAINPSEFYLHNIIDTCAVWNVQSGVMFYCTDFVIYECLHKKRNTPSACHGNLQGQLKSLIEQGKITNFSLSIEDLQEVDRLSSRKRLGKGELSALAFALKTGQAFLSDDQGARRLALSVLAEGRTQTTPHLFSWLIFTGKISDSEKAHVIGEHQANGGDLSPYLELAYQEACRCRYV